MCIYNIFKSKIYKEIIQHKIILLYFQTFIKKIKKNSLLYHTWINHKNTSLTKVLFIQEPTFWMQKINKISIGNYIFLHKYFSKTPILIISNSCCILLIAMKLDLTNINKVSNYEIK